MTVAFPLAAARLFDAPLMIHPGKAAIILEAFGPRLIGHALDIGHFAPALPAGAEGGDHAGVIGNRLGRTLESWGTDGLSRVGNVAVIPIEGTLVHKGAFLGKSSGQTSYEGIQAQVRAAIEARDIAGVVFEIDSFGGEAAGAEDTARMMRELSGLKPTLAILTDNALSAGYFLASQAREIVMPQGGYIGSIGVIRLHYDYSKRLETEGVAVTIIQAGAHKSDGNMFEALPADVLAKLRAEVEASRQIFAASVGAGRGARFSAADALATEAEIYQGDEAVAMGLADAVGSPSEAFDAFVSKLASGPSARPPTQKGTLMSKPAPAAAERAATETMPVDQANEMAEVARCEGRDEGLQEGMTAGAEAERTRIAGILGSEEAKGRTGLAQHCAFRTGMSVDDARATLAAASAEAAPPQAAASPLQQAMDAEKPIDLGAAPGASRTTASDYDKGRSMALAAMGKTEQSLPA